MSGFTEIIGSVMNYEWGKIGDTSLVAQIAKLNNENFTIEPAKSYSELWMGDHLSGPSKIKTTGETLTTFLANNKNDLIGGHSSLPFLFKVLSIQKALSIQVHPNKKDAEYLNAKYPDIYKDSNHKPELTIALTPFLALCGFRPHKEIYSLLKEYNPLSLLIGSQNIEKIATSNDDSGIRECFSILMKTQQSDVITCVSKLLTVFESKPDSLLKQVFATVNTDFPNDVGLLGLFFFNIVSLNPGEAMFLPANIPHAYLSGDCIECMACSDNVIRAGLTPKFKDVDTLLAMLNYEGKTAESQLFEPKLIDNVQYYIPPVKDFAVAVIKIPKNTKGDFRNTKYGSILLIYQGSCCIKYRTALNVAEEKKAIKGNIFFIPGNLKENIEVIVDETEDFIGFQSMYNSF